jgi:hypothetical protein
VLPFDEGVRRKPRSSATRLIFERATCNEIPDDVGRRGLGGEGEHCVRKTIAACSLRAIAGHVESLASPRRARIASLHRSQRPGSSRTGAGSSYERSLRMASSAAIQTELRNTRRQSEHATTLNRGVDSAAGER